MDVELESVHVDVRIHWDFRGTMGVDRDVQLLDGALAEAARWADVPVTDLDTVSR